MNPHSQPPKRSLPEPEKTLLSALHDAESPPPASDYEPFPPPQAARRRYVRRTGIEAIDRLPARWTTIDYGAPAPRVSVDGEEPRSPLSEVSQSLAQEPSCQDSPLTSEVLEAKLEDAWYRFEQQVQQVNRLSSRQEMAVLELRAIAIEVETLWNAIVGQATPQSVLRVDHEATAVLQVQADSTGAWWLTQRSIDWQRITRHAQSTAAALRDIEQRRTERHHEFAARSRQESPPPHRSTRQTEDDGLGSFHSQVLPPPDRPGAQSTPPPAHPPLEPMDYPSEQSVSARSSDPLRLILGMVGRFLQAALSPLRRSRLRGSRRQPQRSHKSHRIQSQSSRVAESVTPFPTFTIQSAAMWITGAAAARIILTIFLSSQPALKPLALMLMVAPAAIAIYQVTAAPKTGFVTAYRLLLILVGLLLGGRLS